MSLALGLRAGAPAAGIANCWGELKEPQSEFLFIFGRGADEIHGDHAPVKRDFTPEIVHLDGRGFVR